MYGSFLLMRRDDHQHISRSKYMLHKQQTLLNMPSLQVATDITLHCLQHICSSYDISLMLLISKSEWNHTSSWIDLCHEKGVSLQKQNCYDKHQHIFLISMPWWEPSISLTSPKLCYVIMFLWNCKLSDAMLKPWKRILWHNWSKIRGGVRINAFYW